jgi:hypothetical protein
MCSEPAAGCVHCTPADSHMHVLGPSATPTGVTAHSTQPTPAVAFTGACYQHICVAVAVADTITPSMVNWLSCSSTAADWLAPFKYMLPIFVASAAASTYAQLSLVCEHSRVCTTHLPTTTHNPPQAAAAAAPHRMCCIQYLFHTRSVSSRSLQQQEAASVQGHQRQLQQNALCPEGCVNDMCIQDSTIGGLRCQKCESNLMINTTDGTCCESLYDRRISQLAIAGNPAPLRSWHMDPAGTAAQHCDLAAAW